MDVHPLAEFNDRRYVRRTLSSSSETGYTGEGRLAFAGILRGCSRNSVFSLDGREVTVAEQRMGDLNQRTQERMRQRF